MWILRLNDMRSSNVETMTSVARAETREELEALVHREQVPRYDEVEIGRTWRKEHRKGGPLEWCNPISGVHHGEGYCYVGDIDDWERQARERFAAAVLSLPEAAELKGPR